MRQIILDTETTGLEVEQGHRIIEIGALELIDRRPSGRSFQRYLNPEREVDAGAVEVHGLTREFLSSQSRFADVARELYTFLAGAELVIHNAPFDLGFLDAEFRRLADNPAAPALAEHCRVLDTLPLARQLHPGQRNSLDALCKRYSVDNSGRELHGALLDAKLLSGVYLAMTGGQAALTLGPEGAAHARAADAARQRHAPLPVPVVSASAEELKLHEQALAAIDKASAGACLFRSH
jgi:DNA polymerase III subunit epsilon